MRTAQTRMTEGGRSRRQQQQKGKAGLLSASRMGADPVDLLDAGASRQLVQAAGGRAWRQHDGKRDDGPDFETNADGQMIVKV